MATPQHPELPSATNSLVSPLISPAPGSPGRVWRPGPGTLPSLGVTSSHGLKILRPSKYRAVTSVWPLSRALLAPGQCDHDRDPEARGESPPAAAQEAGPGHQAQRGQHHHQGEVHILEQLPKPINNIYIGCHVWRNSHLEQRK